MDIFNNLKRIFNHQEASQTELENTIKLMINATEKQAHLADLEYHAMTSQLDLIRAKREAIYNKLGLGIGQSYN